MRCSPIHRNRRVLAVVGAAWVVTQGCFLPSARAWGTFELANRTYKVDAPVYDAAGNPLSGDGYLAQLYVGLTPDWMHPVFPLGQFTRTAYERPGYFSARAIVEVTGMPDDALAWVQVKAWAARLGPTYEAVRDLGIGGCGESNAFIVRSGDPWTLPGLLIGLQSFSLRPTLPLAAPTRRQTGEFAFKAAATVVGRTNVIEASTNLLDWAAIGQVVPSTNTFTFVDTEAPRFPRRFYRLRLEPSWVVGQEGSFVLLNWEGVDAPVYDGAGRPLRGSNYWAQLYAGIRLDSLRPAFPIATFAYSPYNVGGYFTAPDVVRTTNVIPQVPAWVQVKVWDSRLGSSYEVVERLGIGGCGESDPFQALPGYYPWSVRSTLAGLRSFRLRSTLPLAEPKRNATGEFTFSAAATLAGKTNVIEASTNLVDWAAIAQVVPSTNTFTFVDTTAPSFTRRFYRLRLEQ